MKKKLGYMVIFICLAGLVSCASGGARPAMTYFHGEKIPDAYISVAAGTAQEIEFRVRVNFKQQRLYHLVLDGNIPVSEGWFSATRVGEQFYTVKMRPKEGSAFEPGKTYRLCIGAESPDLVGVYSSNYRCLADYEFKLPAAN